MKTYSESRIELRNLQMLKKMLETFLSSEQLEKGEKLECFLEYYWSSNNTLAKHAVAVNTLPSLKRLQRCFFKDRFYSFCFLFFSDTNFMQLKQRKKIEFYR